MSKVLCRTCLCWRPCSSSLMLYCQEEGLYLYEIITSFCQVEMKPDDDFPRDVCDICLDEIRKAFSFKIKCEKSDSALRNDANPPNYKKRNDSTNSDDLIDKIKSETDPEFPSYLGSDCENSETDYKHIPLDECDFDDEKSVPIKNEIDEAKQPKIKKSLKKEKAKKKIPRDKERLYTFIRTESTKPDKSLPKNYDCSFCDYKCSNSSNLKRHVRIHTNDKPYSCEFCSYRCVQSSYLKDHQRLHTGEKPYLCDQCHYRCRSISSLRTHKNNKHSLERKFSCDVCNFKAKTKSTLTVHKKMHAGVKSFTCDLCSYQSIQLSSLENHKLMAHTNERPFACDRCPYRCISSSYLKIHQRTHLPVKALSCDICAYSCHTRFQMKCHLMTHTGEKPHHCSLCDFKCAQASSLRRHLRSHNNKVDVNVS